MTRVLIADDHSIVRDALRLLCAGMDCLEVAGEAETGDEVMEALSRDRFDLILLDLTMPGVSGSSLVEQIHAAYPELLILVFSMRNESQVAKRVLQAGASGYVSKGSRQDVLRTAIQQVLAGEHFVDPLIAVQIMLEKNVRNDATSHTGLSERELQIMQMLARGMGGNEIADELFISYKTVSTYKTRLMQKMKFKSNADLVLYAAEHGLLETESAPAK